MPNTATADKLIRAITRLLADNTAVSCKHADKTILLSSGIEDFFFVFFWGRGRGLEEGRGGGGWGWRYERGAVRRSGGGIQAG